MTTKPASPGFLPTPRPRPLTDPAATAALQEATRDLGFARQTSAPSPVPEPAPVTSAVTEPPAPARLDPRVVAAPKAQAKPRAAATKAAMAPTPAPKAEADEGRKRPAALRIEVDEALWAAIRMAAIKRRVSVKYLIHEALAAQGFDIDMTAIADDGRRVR